MGHTGTLDPFATGLLIVLVGRATRLSKFLVGLPKEYTGVMRLGVETDSHDLNGETTSESEAWKDVTREMVDSEMSAMLGPQEQVPPAFSAKKIGGKRAYRIARQGKDVNLPPQKIEVSAFEAMDLRSSDLAFRCKVSSGTYVRALARDLGKSLGCGAHLRELRRVSIGPFTLDDAVALDDVDAESVTVGSPARAVAFLPQIEIKSEDERQRIAHGQPVSAETGDDDVVALVFGEQLVAIAERRGEMLRPKVVMEG